MIVVALAISGVLSVTAGVALVVTWARVIADAAYHQTISNHRIRGN